MVDERAEQLDSSGRHKFHTTVCKLFHLAKRVRPDLLMAVGYLTTRVRAPTTQDKEKLGRVLKYLNQTRDLYLTLASNGDVPSVECFIDAVFATHLDKKSHTGCAVSLGRGAVFATSLKQDLNSKSSTEAELVGVSDAIGQALWTRNFLET